MKTTEIIQNKLERFNDGYQIFFDAKGKYFSVNNHFAHTFHADETAWKETFLYNDTKPEDWELINNAIESCTKEIGVTYILHLHHFNKIAGNICIEWEITATDTFEKLFFIARGIQVNTSIKSNITSKPSFSQQDINLSPARLNNILDYSLDIICVVDEDGRFLLVSKACKNIWGYDPEELIGKKYIASVYEEDIEKTIAARIRSRSGELKNFENRYVRKDGSIVTMFWTARWDTVDKIMYCVARDGTTRKNYESAIKTSEEKYKILFYKNPQPMWIYQVTTYKFLEVNEATIKKYGYSREEFLAMTIKDIRPADEIPKLFDAARKQEHSSTDKSYWKHKTKDGEVMDVEITAHSLIFEGNEAKLVLAYDVTEQLKAEDKLIRSNERYTYASKAAFDAIWDWDLKNDELYWSEGYETLFGYRLEDNKESDGGTWSNHIHPQDKEKVLKKLDEVIKTGDENFDTEYRFKKADGTYAYVIDRGITIRNEKNEPYRMIGAMQDYTEKEKNEQILKELNASLEKRASELASSNQELERFAYVASHDLQEPLRMVSSFLQLLQKRYKAQLDDKANEYIHFAVDGAERMKILILDLLKYSRVNTMKEEHELVDLNEIAVNLLLTYNQIARDTHAIVTIDPLPKVIGTKTQLAQLFQNLVSNALKYRSTKPPDIHVGVTEHQTSWQFFVRDNGIGIDPRFYHKIFVIFQRLHHKDEYSGTGIGLAICKKIVERHGGKIWVESTDMGSTFYFTIKKNLKISVK